MGLFLAALAVALAEPAVGDPQLAIEWRAPIECPDAERVAASIGGVTDPAAVRVRVDVVREGEELVAQVAIDGVDGPVARTLRSPSCESIVEAVALLAQIAGEPRPVVDVPLPDPPAPGDATLAEPPVLAARSPAPPPAEPPRASRPPRPPTPPRIEVRAAGLVGAGSVPRLDVGARATIGIITRWVHVELGGQYLAPLVATALRGDVRLRVQAWAVLVRACPTLPVLAGRLELGICASAGIGQIRGTARGPALRAPGEGARPMLTLAGGPELAVAVARRVRVFAGLEVGGRPVRSGFAIAGLGPIGTPRPWVVAGLVGVAVRLP